MIGPTLASVAPAGMNAVGGTSTCGMSLMTVTMVPPAGAGPFNVMRACVDAPPYVVPGSVMIHAGFRPGGVGGDATTVNGLPADHGPSTSPCCARTRQK